MRDFFTPNVISIYSWPAFVCVHFCCTEFEWCRTQLFACQGDCRCWLSMEFFSPVHLFAYQWPAIESRPSKLIFNSWIIVSFFLVHNFSMNMVKSHLLNRNTLVSAIIGVVPKEIDASNSDEDRVSMHPIGTAGIVIQVTGTNWPRPSYTLLVTGLCRFKLENLAQESPYLVGGVKQLDKFPTECNSLGL